jgi:hypothetical protein
MALAHKLAMQLRAAEDRISQLEAEVALFETGRPEPKVAKSSKAHRPEIGRSYRTNIGLIRIRAWNQAGLPLPRTQRTVSFTDAMLRGRSAFERAQR